MITIDEQHNLLTLDQAALNVYQRIVEGPGFKGCVCIIESNGNGYFTMTILGQGIAPIRKLWPARVLSDYHVRALSPSDSFTITLQADI